jgi:L-tartrate/succinate antiporter
MAELVKTEAPRTAEHTGPESSGTARIAAPIAIALLIVLLPAPEGLSVNAWRYFGLFAGVVVGIIAEPIPAAAVGLTGVVLATVLGLVHSEASESTEWALSGFANDTVWLIFAAYMLAMGYAKTGLGKRIALWLIRALGKRTLGLGFAIALADLFLAPFMPSSTARSGGTIYPIISNIPGLFGSKPHDPSRRKIGSYLMYTALATTCVTSCIFPTGHASNLLAISLIAETTGVTITWADWLKGFLPIGIILFPMVPLLLYKIYPPEIRESPDASNWAQSELRRMGPMAAREQIMFALALVALVIWIAGGEYVEAAIAAVFVILLMVILGVVSWDDILRNTSAWNMLIWFATMVTLARGLATTGFVGWVGQSIAPMLSTLSVSAAIVVLVGAFYYMHYLFASTSAHTSALLPVFLGVAALIPDLSAMSGALLLAYPLGLIGILTPYGIGPSPIYYGGGYIPGRDFWIYGFILGLIFFVVYMAMIIPWLRFLGV